MVTYLINAYAPMIEGLRPYRIVSPFYYYNGKAVLINGLVISHALVLAGLIAVLSCRGAFILQPSQPFFVKYFETPVSHPINSRMDSLFY